MNHIEELFELLPQEELEQRILSSQEILVQKEISYEFISKPGVKAGYIYSSVLKLVENRCFSKNFMGFGDKKVKFIGHGIALVISFHPETALFPFGCVSLQNYSSTY